MERAKRSTAALAQAGVAVQAATLFAMIAAGDVSGQVVAAAQSDDVASSVIAGRALLAFNDAPLDGAVVYIEDSEFTAIADPDGFFGLGPLMPGMYRLILFHPALNELGWAEAPTQLVIVPPASDVQVDFIIDEAGVMIEAGGAGSEDNPYFLDPLTIVGKRSIFERPTEEGARVDFAGLEEVQAREGAARHVGDLIRNFPSLHVFEPQPGMVCIASRRRTTDTPNPGSQLGEFDQTGGAGVNRSRLCPKMVQVYVDDIAIHRAEEFLASLSPQNIERVEYVNGVAAGARFGTGYAEGVLLLYTRRPTIGKKKPN